MQTSYTCEAASADRPNDDFVLATERFVIVLDGATEPVGIDSGCVHDVPWLVATLATHLARLLVASGSAPPAPPAPLAPLAPPAPLAPLAPLADILHAAIADTMASHADTCDLTNPDSPSTTVAILRRGVDTVDYAVLGDSAILIEQHDGNLLVAHDDRTAHLPPHTRADVSRLRNSDAGFWIASTQPDAADKAVSGSIPLATVSRAVVMTDGITRLVERYGRSWSDLLTRLDEHGPAQLVADVRAAELATPPGAFRGKVHDDVTAVFCRF